MIVKIEIFRLDVLRNVCTLNTVKWGKSHYANMSMQYTVIFHGCKNDNFQMKICNIFAQNIDCGYKLELPH